MDLKQLHFQYERRLNQFSLSFSFNLNLCQNSRITSNVGINKTKVRNVGPLICQNSRCAAVRPTAVRFLKISMRYTFDLLYDVPRNFGKTTKMEATTQAISKTLSTKAPARVCPQLQNFAQSLRRIYIFLSSWVSVTWSSRSRLPYTFHTGLVI